ncbi:hypothetical protein [Burkholderia gladioli]|uniref:hypothetical protein n=1 Tax=Burkholderia gladioli TaxID=28095 RepID=UPI00163E8834|nr:hypothetical protein [Burkholderia gladioli]
MIHDPASSTVRRQDVALIVSGLVRHPVSDSGRVLGSLTLLLPYPLGKNREFMQQLEWLRKASAQADKRSPFPFIRKQIGKFDIKF